MGPAACLNCARSSIRFVGYDFAVFYNQAPQAYAPKPGACGLACNNPAVSLGGRAVGSRLPMWFHTNSEI